MEQPEPACSKSMPKKPRKRALKRQLKQKLSLTISPEMRVKARKLARKQRRSLSSLFEYLIAMEFLRQKSKDPYDPRTNTGIYRLAQRVTQ
jgi:hypothetical protein